MKKYICRTFSALGPGVAGYRLHLNPPIVYPLNDEDFLSRLRDLLLAASNLPEKSVKFNSSV